MAYLEQQTIQWNLDRGNTTSTLNWDLEIAMLQEELDELKAATQEVDKFDALLDLKFVLIGSLGKMGLTSEQIDCGYSYVLEANKTKSASKTTEGKIAKPDNFPNPEPRLQQLLDERI